MQLSPVIVACGGLDRGVLRAGGSVRRSSWTSCTIVTRGVVEKKSNLDSPRVADEARKGPQAHAVQ